MRRFSFLTAIAVSATTLFAPFPLFGGKPAPAPSPPSAMVFGAFSPTNGPGGEWLDFNINQLTFTRSFTVPADGAWFWGDAKYDTYVEMDCYHHYVGTINPTDSTYN